MDELTNRKVVVISDLHLGKRFDQAKFMLIKQAVESGDKLVINGDLWEGFDFDFTNFIESGWQQLFPLFKDHDAIYLFGNHDPKQNRSELYERFSLLSGTKYEFSQNGTHFTVTHGDLFDPTLDLRHPRLPRPVLSIGSKIERLLIRIFGVNYLKFYLQNNAKMRAWKKKNLPASSWLICGHSHLAEVRPSERYANSGIFLAPGLASYLRVENGQVELVRL